VAFFASPIKQLFLGYPKQRRRQNPRRGSTGRVGALVLGRGD